MGLTQTLTSLEHAQTLMKMVGSAGLLAQQSEKPQQDWQNDGFSQCLRRVALYRNLS
jgi:hypothetical protein